MTKPLLNSIFKVTSILVSAANVTHQGYEDFHDGWIQGRKNLALYIFSELEFALKVIPIIVNEAIAPDPGSESYGDGWIQGRRDLSQQILKELGVDHEVL
jgi:hypothetical protein